MIFSNQAVDIMNDVKKLKNYIDFLKREHNLSVSLNINDDENITKEQLNTLIAPLCNMLDISYNPETDDISSDIITSVKKYLEEHCSQNISSADICKALACSRSHISHQFKNQTGMSIREYLTKLRINDAKHLLEYSDLTVTEIAFTVGFGSSNYFTNVFKKELGIAPGAYRRKVRESK